MKYKIFELTNENEKFYIDKLVKLEETVLKIMEKEGKVGQLFITGKEDISEYIHSNDNSVIVATDENDNIISATYITQGQVPFSYNDITKYFKYGESYQENIKEKYSNIEYKINALETYKLKIEAFKYALEQLKIDYPNYVEDDKLNIEKFLKDEIQKNDFHEKSELREKINKYMYNHISEGNDSREKLKKYEEFYWLNCEKLSKMCNKDINLNIVNRDILAYERYLNVLRLNIHETSLNNEKKYYNANTNNAIEIDTYITLPDKRSEGLSRILVYEGIKKHMLKHFENPENKEAFLCSTLHRLNLSSKYVSEFFGLIDNVYVKRRMDRNREVHITQIERENSIEYLNNIENKLAVLYGYNPNNKGITPKEQIQILKEQRKYDLEELKRIRTLSSENNNYRGIDLRNNEHKINKIRGLNRRINLLKNNQIACKKEVEHAR